MMLPPGEKKKEVAAEILKERRGSGSLKEAP